MAPTACSLYITIFLKSKFKSGSSNSKPFAFKHYSNIIQFLPNFSQVKKQAKDNNNKNFLFYITLQKIQLFFFKAKFLKRMDYDFFLQLCIKLQQPSVANNPGKSLGLLLRNPPMTLSIRHSQWPFFIPPSYLTALQYLRLSYLLYRQIIVFLGKSSSISCFFSISDPLFVCLLCTGFVNGSFMFLSLISDYKSKTWPLQISY